MRDIIAAVDFSDASYNAARYAADLAAAIGADLHLIHVLDLPPGSPRTPISPNVLDDIRNSGLTGLKSLADELAARTGKKVSVATDQETGPLEKRLREFCRWKNPFLVVRGAPRGDSPSIQRLSYPLLTVPAFAHFHQLRHIVLACDQADIEKGMPLPVTYLRELRVLFNAHFDILHVDTRQRYAATDGPGQKYPELHFINASTVEEGINDYVVHHPSDWLVVFPKRGGLFHLHKSLSGNVVLHCPVPVVSFGEH